jgi:hypothetical protein
MKPSLEFLGQRARPQNDKLLPKPSKKNRKQFLSNVREVISRLANVQPEVLV